VKINIGAGYKRYPDFVNVDQDSNTNPDYQVNLETENLPFEDNTVEYVIAHHILEHLGEGYFHLLQELYRVCKNGAIIDIRVPHPNHEIFLNDPTHKRPVTVEGLRLFSKTYNQMEIARNGSSSTLGLRYNVDFEIVGFNFIHDPYYDELKKTLDKSELERLFREALNTTMEIHVKLMVNKERE
jgi:SAM-dependent methyltransferase